MRHLIPHCHPRVQMLACFACTLQNVVVIFCLHAHRQPLTVPPDTTHHSMPKLSRACGVWATTGSVTLVYIAHVPPAYFPGTTHHGVQILHTYVQFYRHHTPQCIAKCREVMPWCVVPDKNLKECKLTAWCPVKSRQFADGCKYPHICTQRQVYPFYCEAWCVVSGQKARDTPLYRVGLESAR